MLYYSVKEHVTLPAHKCCVVSDTLRLTTATATANWTLLTDNHYKMPDTTPRVDTKSKGNNTTNTQLAGDRTHNQLVPKPPEEKHPSRFNIL